MRRFDDLTWEELAALTDEEVKKLIELEEAHEGILPVSRPDEPEYHDIQVAATEKYYQVGDLLFGSEEDAKTVLQMPLYTTEYDYPMGYDYKWAGPIAKELKVVALYNKSEVEAVKLRVVENKEMKEVFEKLNKAYKRYVDASTDVREAVWRAIGNARIKLREVEDAKTNWLRHKELAEGNEDIARRFFIKAYKDKPKIIGKVLGEQYTPEPEPVEA